MRKADYALLASYIKSSSGDARVSGIALPDKAEYYLGKIDALRSLAVDFAHRSNVDKTAFLSACGILKTE